MDYDFRDIEERWQKHWKENRTYATQIIKDKPKYYVLDMFPYPSGAGLHVGHPLGYIATDIVSRYKRNKGFNVLHPMGYDAFGLPAEQYAIQTGQHPAITTENNIKRYREQLERMGFCYDWEREVRTSDPSFYKWTQWIFIKLFNCWYDNKADKARYIDELIEEFGKNGNSGLDASHSHENSFSAEDWNVMNEEQQQNVLLDYRLAYLSDTYVNWCPELGTVLANEEVKDGLSERGGHPVERKLMRQWSLRISAYAERLLNDLNDIDWPEPLKEAQRNWIGRSEGASMHFKIKDHNESFEIFTTRPDTIFGVSFMVLAPEHELVSTITTDDKRSEVDEYVKAAMARSERDRMSDVKKVTGVFTGAHAVHPFTGEDIPIWVADYVLAGYGTGAIMAVPSGDQRDHDFAKQFNIPIPAITEGADISESANDSKDGIMINSDFLNGLTGHEAIRNCIARIEEMGIGAGKINYRLRDAIFSRQRYWGEPFPVYFKDGIPFVMDESELPLLLPEVDKYLPTETGEPPLARADNWKTKDGHPIETSTMPGWAGSSWYYLRYMDANNDKEFLGDEAAKYWKEVDLYIGGSEHATGHLLYVRFWTKFLKDLGFIDIVEPAKKLVNQGMIQGTSSLVYRINGTNEFVSLNLKKDHETTAIHVDVNMVQNNILDIEEFKKWRPEFNEAEHSSLEEGNYICGSEVEKMSKRWHNVVNPDDIIDQFGTDTLRMYEMFLGPLELSKPWNTNGIDGVHKFLRKFWRLFHDRENQFVVSDEQANKDELKVLHKTIKKFEEDIERLSFNTTVSAFMICVNELTDLKCHKRDILEPLCIMLSSYAPHIAEELWMKLGKEPSVVDAPFPALDESHLVEDSFEYPVSVNGKLRFKIELPMNMQKQEIEEEVLKAEDLQKWLNEGNPPKKVIVVPGRIVNVVV